jgi:hypothetical protein
MHVRCFGTNSLGMLANIDQVTVGSAVKRACRNPTSLSLEVTRVSKKKRKYLRDAMEVDADCSREDDVCEVKFTKSAIWQHSRKNRINS